MAIIGLLSVAMLAFCVWLLKRSLWPARNGTTPHCPKCDYILTGIEADRCPECGKSIGPGNFVRGERHRKPRLATVAVAMILLTAAPWALHLFHVLQRVNWYHHYPTTWVMRDLDAT